MKMNITTA